MNLRRVLFCVVAVGLLASAQVCRAGVGFRQLTSMFPVAVQRGTQATVRLRSNYTLDETHTVLFYKRGTQSGIKMTLAETKPIAALPDGTRSSAGTPFRFHVQVPANQDPGVYELRVATKKAVSSVSHLLVTDFPVIEEQEQDNGTAATAQPISVPAAVCGVCERFEDVDYYRFTGKAGQELTIQIYAQRVTEGIYDMAVRIGVQLMDSTLVLSGPRGQVVARNNNFLGGDSLLSCKLSESGEYILKVYDYRYAGDPRYTYCVEISDRPFVHAVFPAAVQRGTTTQVKVKGHGLGGLEQATISTTADEPLGWKNVRLETPAGTTNLVSVLVSPYRNIVAPKGHGTIETATPVSLPVGINGWISEPQETHYFVFEALKGRDYRFEIESPHRGLPLDSVIEIYSAAGQMLVEADDGTLLGNPSTQISVRTKDAKLSFQAPADGEYFLAVRDLHDRGGERFCYHLRAESSRPDFEVYGEYYYAMLAPGTQSIWFARIQRTGGFNGPVKMSVEGLPQGVTLTPVTVPAGMDHCGLILSAAANAKLGASLAHVCGRAQLSGADGNPYNAVRYGRITCEQRRAGASMLERWPIQTQIVGITEPLDVTNVEVTSREITLRPGEKTEIKVRIARNQEFRGLVVLDMAFTFGRSGTPTFGHQLPPGVTMSKTSKTRLADKELEGIIVLQAASDALPVNRLPIAAMARVSVPESSMTTDYASEPVFLTVLAADKSSNK